jgi:hypothetical protein
MTFSGKNVTPGMWYYLNDDREVVEYTGTYEDMDKTIDPDEAERRRIVKQEYLPGGYWLSTVFLGISHSFDEVPGKFFETMLFDKDDEEGSGHDLYMERYDTWDEAEAGHERIKAAFIEGNLETYKNGT